MFYPSLTTTSGAPTLLDAAVAVVLMLIMIPSNYYGVRAFGMSTTPFGVIKLLFYIAVGFTLAFVFFDPKNFSNYKGFLPFGFSGVFAAIPFAMFALGGISVLPDYAEETRNFRRLPSAIILVIIGQLLLYLFLDSVFVGGIDWAKLGINPGDWVGISGIPGNPFITISHAYNSHVLLALTLIVGIIGPFVVGYMYLGAGTRIVFAQGRSQIMPKLVKDIHERYSIPYWALLITALVGAILAFISAPVPSIWPHRGRCSGWVYRV